MSGTALASRFVRFEAAQRLDTSVARRARRCPRAAARRAEMAKKKAPKKTAKEKEEEYLEQCFVLFACAVFGGLFWWFCQMEKAGPEEL
jgi:hypothetical protein